MDTGSKVFPHEHFRHRCYLIPQKEVEFRLIYILFRKAFLSTLHKFHTIQTLAL